MLKPTGTLTLPDGGAGLTVDDATKRRAVENASSPASDRLIVSFWLAVPGVPSADVAQTATSHLTARTLREAARGGVGISP